MIIVSLHLGPAVNLASRTLTVVDMSAVPPSEIDEQVLAGSAESADVSVPDNRPLRATLVDVSDAGHTLAPAVLHFQSNWPELQRRVVSGAGQLAIVSLDEESSSSSQSSSSLSSSSSTSSRSSSTLSSSSSSSSHSRSSSSLSSSSRSTSSASSSSTSSSSS